MENEILTYIKQKGECDTEEVAQQLNRHDYDGWIQTRKELDDLVRSGSLKIRWDKSHAYFSVVA